MTVSRKTTEQFIHEAKSVHGDKYDYSGVNYLGATEKVSIGCTKHGRFNQVATKHLRGSGCPRCAKQQIPIRKRFRGYIRESSGNCWVWTGSIDWDGYGLFSLNHKTIKASRMAWKLYRGEIPENTLVLHKCDNPSCVNPEHLFLGSHADNVKDKISKGRQSMGDKHGKSKLTESLVSKIKKRLSSGERRCDLALYYGVSVSAIHSIATGRTWGHVKPLDPGGALFVEKKIKQEADGEIIFA